MADDEVEFHYMYLHISLHLSVPNINIHIIHIIHFTRFQHQLSSMRFTAALILSPSLLASICAAVNLRFSGCQPRQQKLLNEAFLIAREEVNLIQEFSPGAPEIADPPDLSAKEVERLKIRYFGYTTKDDTAYVDGKSVSPAPYHSS